MEKLNGISNRNSNQWLNVDASLTVMSLWSAYNMWTSH